MLPVPALALLLLLPLPSWSAAPDAPVVPAEKCAQTAALLRRLSDLVEFFAADADRVNADGYFGVRMSRLILTSPAGRIRQALTLLDETACAGVGGRRRLLERILNRQRLLLQRLTLGLSGNSGYDGNTLALICEPLVDRLGRLLAGQRGASREPPSVGDGKTAADAAGLLDVEYNEAVGDACLLEALQPDCAAPRRCSYFDRPLEQSSGYYLTHQFLYRLSGALGTCSPDSELLEVAGRPPSHLTVSCGKIFREYKTIEAANWTKIAIERHGGVVGGLRDLYMEQAFLCGLLGARTFYHRESVDTVASWQDPELGCFKISADLPAAWGSVAKSHGRKMLRDVAMIGGCSAHASGLAMSFYSQALRFLLEA